jgi:hypothetical protein
MSSLRVWRDFASFTRKDFDMSTQPSKLTAAALGNEMAALIVSIALVALTLVGVYIANSSATDTQASYAFAPLADTMTQMVPPVADDDALAAPPTLHAQRQSVTAQ